MALIIVMSVMNGFENELKKRILGVVPHITVTNDEEKLQQWRPLVEQLNDHETVAQVSPIVSSEGLIQSSTAVKGIMLQGVEPELANQHSIIASHMLLGELTDLQKGSYYTVISRALARQLRVNLGDKVRIMVTGASSFTPVGMLPSQRLFTVAGIFELGSEIDDKVAIVNISDAARLLKMGSDDVSAIRLFMEDAFDAPVLANELKQQLPQYKVSDWRATQGKLFSAVRMEKTMMTTMLALIVAVALFNIVSALVMLINDKKSDVAILQTLGLNSQQVSHVFIFNGFYNGLLGGFIGVIVGLIVALNLNQIISVLGLEFITVVGPQGLPVLIESHQVIVVAMSAIFMSFLATLYPGYYVSQMKPADVLREE